MTSSLAVEADRLAAGGDLLGAARLLARLAAAQPEDLALWLKLAGLQRAMGKTEASLVSVHRALAVQPLDFTEAGEAWGHALAQRPDTDLPPQLASVVASAEQHYEAWRDQREAELKERMEAAEGKADADERHRIERFRSNVLRRTSPYHSNPTHYHYPSLPEREFHPRSLFPWLEELEAATEEIAYECQAVMASERAELVQYVQYDDHLPMDQWRPLNRNPDWTAIHLLEKGERAEPNAGHCPRTLELLSRLPQPVMPGASPNAMFSLLAPNTAIPPHVGISNTRLVCHLPLVIPEGCWFRVGAETRYWKRGEAFVFDDTIEHEALNPTDRLRIVFIFDVWAPDLSATEREAVAALFGSAQGEALGL